MKPALFLYPHVGSYSFLLLLGFFFGWILARRRAALYEIAPNHLDNISLILPLAGLFGGRFFARLFYAKVSFFEALKVWEGDGLVFYGGFIFGVGSVLVYGWLRRLNLVRLCDCLAPSVAVGLAFGRVGCFLAGCCWGDVCVDDRQLAGIQDQTVLARIHTVPAISHANFPWAVRFPEKSEAFKQHAKLGLIAATDSESLPVHPVQLYEAVLAAGLAVWLHLKGRKRAGDISIGLLLGYAGIRFVTEFLRADNKVYAWHLTFSQVVSIEIALAALAIVALRLVFRTRVSQRVTANAAVREPVSAGN